MRRTKAAVIGDCSPGPGQPVPPDRKGLRVIQEGLPALKGHKASTVHKVRPDLKEPMDRWAHKARQAIQEARRDHKVLKDRKATMVLKVRLALQAPVM